MALDFEQLKFGGLVQRVALEEFGGTFSDSPDRGNSFIASLYDEFKAEVPPVPPRRWIRARLQDYFRWVQSKPAWIESRSLPVWPFAGDRPMVFIGQFDVPDRVTTSELLSPGSTLYIFGARVAVEGGWMMEYRVVSQLKGLP